MAPETNRPLEDAEIRQRNAEDLSVIEQFLAQPGSPEAQDQLLRRFGPSIEQMVAGQLGPASLLDREDIVQDVFVRILSRDLFQRYDSSLGAPRAYLRTIISNHVKDLHRRRARLSQGGPQDYLLDEGTELARGFPPRSEDQLLEAIREHLAEHRIPIGTLRIYNRYLEFCSAKQVAAEFDFSIETAYRHRRDLLTIAREVLSRSASKEKKSSA
jgi:RNA polymerase sigma factor (sigma-70 family)